MKSGERVATGTGKERRRLTREEAEAGVLPEPFTKEEWSIMQARSEVLHADALEKLVSEVETFRSELMYQQRWVAR